MPWFKVDDSFYDHPKLIEVPNAAVGLWTKAGSWCARHLTDGVIPATKVKALGGTKSQTNALVSSGLWLPIDTPTGAKAFAFCNWNEYQPTKESVEKERAEAAQRKRKSRQRKGAGQQESENVTRDMGRESRDMSQGESHVAPSDVSRCESQFPDPTRPDPTHKEVKDKPTTEVVETTPKRKRHNYPPEFEQWWKLYPRHVGKPDALKAWKQADVTEADLNTLTRDHAHAWREAGTDTNFIPHPATWLRREGWNDEPAKPTTHSAHAKPRTDLDDFLDNGWKTWGGKPTTPQAPQHEQFTIEHDPDEPPF